MPKGGNVDLAELARSADYLKREGLALPDLSAARATLAVKLENDRVNTTDLDAATRLGLIGRVDWEALKPLWIDRQMQHWLSRGDPELKHMNYALRGLVLLDELTPADRE